MKVVFQAKLPDFSMAVDYSQTVNDCLPNHA